MATYYDRQIARLGVTTKYQYQMKLHSHFGETNWLSISAQQLEAIRKLLNDGAEEAELISDLNKLNDA